MIVAELVTLVAILAASWFSVRRVEKLFAERLAQQDAAEEARRVALYKQQKASERNIARSDAAVRKIADRTRSLQDEVQRTVRRIDRLADDQKREG